MEVSTMFISADTVFLHGTAELAEGRAYQRHTTLPDSITSSPSLRNFRTLPLPISTSLVPFQQSSSMLPSESSV